MDKKNNTGSENSGNYNSGDRNSGYRNSGHFNSGNYNSGDRNSGYRNSGHFNSGHFNSGYFNSGNYNRGDRNSGDFNSGHFNSGNYNRGDRNSGHRNSGHFNSGDYNSGKRNSGMFNTDEPKMRMFNKDSDYTYSEFRNKFGYKDILLSLTIWIYKEHMTDKEKKSVDGWSERGGYLKTLDYKEAWAKAWSEASEKQKNWYKNLPNFDADIFEEITGIKVKEEVEEMTMEDVCKALGKTIKIKK